jgi:hypothetical protein
VDRPVRKPIIIPAVPIGQEPALPPGATRWGTNLERHKELEKEMTEAAAKTPGAVIEALSPKEITFGGRKVHEMTVQTYLNLVDLKSPFIERKPGAEVTPTMREVMASLWAMVTDDEEVRVAIAKGGDELAARIGQFCASVSLAEMTGGSEAVDANVTRAFAPAAHMNPPQAEGGGAPLDETSSATAPAGS